jgi:hypothetical protein
LLNVWVSFSQLPLKPEKGNLGMELWNEEQTGKVRENPERKKPESLKRGTRKAGIFKTEGR